MDSTSSKIIRSLLNDPAAASSAEVDLLEQTIKEYPYFHTAYLLLTFARKHTDPGLGSGQLPRIALHVRNRSLLHQTLRGTRPAASVLPAPEASETPFYFQAETTLSAPAAASTKTPVSPKPVMRPDVIERFLEHPRIFPPEKDTDFKANIAESLQENGDLATETLAGIYLNQGYIKKALGVYKILILKYPEKSSYFAAQIEKLEQELI